MILNFKDKAFKDLGASVDMEMRVFRFPEEIEIIEITEIGCVTDQRISTYLGSFDEIFNG